MSAKFLKTPGIKYKPFQGVNLPNRTWPSRTLTKPPRWLSTDLRDGNQSLPDPMTVAEKQKLFAKIVQMGYKEIEVAFPSASQTDFNFTRFAVESAPADVWIQTLAPCRKELISRTVESLLGAKKAIVHIYIAASDNFRDVIFKLSRKEALDLAVDCTKHVRALTKDDPRASSTEWAFEFSPEAFSDTDPDYAVELCEAVKQAWGPTTQQPIIFNLPATVEMASANVYADQIEYFCSKISERSKVCVSVHPHNDRGSAVAAAELAQLAGADRVEGCLFGNGERTGNVDLVTLGLNLYTQGIHPNIDFSDISSIVETVESCNKIPVHPRAPYGGSLVTCAFSGSHQDAIKKGFALRDAAAKSHEHPWQIPYLPVDPADIGRTYEAVIRVNSQSGKGGAAWIILRKLGLDLPWPLQVRFSQIVQENADKQGLELRNEQVVNLFEKEYLSSHDARLQLSTFAVTPSAGDNTVRIFSGVVTRDGKPHQISGTGNGPISSFLNALKREFDIDLSVKNFAEHSIGSGSDTKAATYIELQHAQEPRSVWGVGIHEDVSQASMQAIVSVLNRVM